MTPDAAPLSRTRCTHAFKRRRPAQRAAPSARSATIRAMLSTPSRHPSLTRVLQLLCAQGLTLRISKPMCASAVHGGATTDRKPEKEPALDRQTASVGHSVFRRVDRQRALFSRSTGGAGGPDRVGRRVVVSKHEDGRGLCSSSDGRGRVSRRRRALSALTCRTRRTLPPRRPCLPLPVLSQMEC